jgi:tartrate/fumarate subfamily iron-sulfur-dependent hydro-lyase alpha chain
VVASISYDVIEQSARDMYGRALEKYPPDLVACIEEAASTESNPVAKKHFELMRKAIDEGKKRHIPVCQDTGMQSFYLRCGTRLDLNGSKVEAAIRNGVRRLTAETLYRATVVHSVTRAKSGLQIGEGHPAVYWDWIDDADYLEMLVLSKGSGSENKSALKMLVPADGVNGIRKFVIDTISSAGGQFCPPGVVGIGVGGTFDSVAHMAKLALLRPLDVRHPDPAIAALEQELCQAINDLKIGPMGLGGDTTVFAVNIEHSVTHETQNPVAVNVQCWAHRKSGVRIRADGSVEEIDYFGARHQ